MNELLQKLKMLFDQQPPPAPVPEDPLLATAPWRIPQGAAPSPALPMPPASTPMTPAPGQRAEDVMPTMADEALIQALRRKQMNQLFSAAGGSPMPQ